ncbi:phosphate signaling complex protein PhoU [Vagococcus humatus]|uniref:Phosphate-specific transport system accessory protein PhoU n=1 Tax=Vagococcus humatus TaxID=1889241 RepID=A0A3R9YK93_9ENTE|nr:phosphate signaling complex protein PhoU [Vagococcus humatus]RST89656.1 phosphate transport system regulatory protein PhoU [Vagococcus humatus]
MLRTQFEEDLQQLHKDFFEMGLAVSDAVYKSVHSFIQHDKKLAQEVIENDVVINDMEVSLEKKSLEMIALQQPVTTDLRIIVTVMKASSDLERMADHAVSIAKATIRVKGTKRILEVEEKIATMASEVKTMIDDVMNAYVNEDYKAAKEIATQAEEVNDYFNIIYGFSIESMKENPETIEGGADYLQVVGFLKRIADYATNICEWIVYLHTGKILELHSNHEFEQK